MKDEDAEVLMLSKGCQKVTEIFGACESKNNHVTCSDLAANCLQGEERAEVRTAVHIPASYNTTSMAKPYLPLALAAGCLGSLCMIWLKAVNNVVSEPYMVFSLFSS